MRVLSFGSLNIDYVYKVDHFVNKGETLSSKSLQVFTGGKGLNQSIALAKAGVEVYHAGMIGEDGKMLLEALDEAGVHTEYVKVQSKIRTGNAIIQNDLQGDNCILLYGGANQQIEETYIDEVLEQFGSEDWLLIQNEINNLPYLVSQAKKKGMRIILNPSPMNEKIEELPLDKIDYFILNEVEAQQLLGKELKDDRDGKILAVEIKAAFPGAVIVLTQGEKGSVYYDGEECIRQEIFKVKAVDTTAAGDTFTGYFIGGVLNGDSPEEAMRAAAKASAIAVTRPGAAPSIPTKEEVESMTID